MKSALWGLLAIAALTGDMAAKPNQYYLYVGTYTGPKSKGIHAFRYDPA